MSWQPDPSQAWRAIDAYLRIAYETTPPTAVRTRLETLRSAPADQFYASPVFERVGQDEPTRYLLRLGNRFYPHMKLAIERAPDGSGALLRADTHDRHIQPAPGSPEAAAFTELVRKNQALADQIEAAWDAEGLMTFKRFLREDLARRAATKVASDQLPVASAEDADRGQ